MTEQIPQVNEFQRALLREAESPWIRPIPTFEDILSGREFAEGLRDGWGRFIPADVQHRWRTLSIETRIVAYCTAVEAVGWVAEIYESRSDEL